MIRAAIISGAGGSRHVGASAFPLTVGGDGADIACPGAQAQRTLAWIGLSRGHAFLQPALADGVVTRNGVAVSDSEWIRHGDCLRIAGLEIRVEIRSDVLALAVASSERGADVRAPSSPPPSPLVVPAVAESGLGAPPRIQLRPRSRRSRAISIAALLILGALLSATGFVFLSAAATIRIAPAPDRLTVEGAFPHLKVGDRYLMLPGTYRLRASRGGYRELDETLHVERGRHLDLAFELVKQPGLLSVRTRPADGVRISIDGAAAGEAPLADVELEAGLHRLRAESERYLADEREIEIEGLGTRQTIEIALTPRWASVSISSEPDGAEVWIAGELRGSTPLGVELLEGSHEVEVRKAGYRNASAQVTVVPNEPQVLPPFVLAEADATVIVETVPGGASVTVDGRFAGRSPLTLSLSPRQQHELHLSLSGYAALTRRLVLEPQERRALRLTLAPRLGVVFITADPADAELIVDGVARGAATGRHELTATAHDIEVRREGYESHRVTLTPRVGASRSLDVRLKRIERAAARSIETGEGHKLELIPPGRLQMGASRREPGRRANEGLRTVVLSRPFYFARREVTNAEFRRFDPTHSSGAASAASLDADGAPVAGVTWTQAARYLNWLSRKDALPPAYEERGDQLLAIRPPTIGYRLPTEAEWAYVARRAGRGRQAKYPWGGNFPPTGRAGNYADQSARGILVNVIAGYDDGYPASAPVASFDANPLGIFDLGGNVAEWCHDVYSARSGADGEVDPLGPVEGRHRVVRGSSWRHASISELRLSYRDYSDKARNDLGFRIARYLR